MIIGLFGFSWYLIGVLNCIFMVWYIDADKITVKELKSMLIISLFGPLLTAMIIVGVSLEQIEKWNIDGDTVIWRKK